METKKPIEGHMNSLTQLRQLYNKVPHLLMVPVPMQGHINPLMHLAQKIVDECKGGVLVTFLNTKVTQDMLEKARNNTNADNEENYNVGDSKNINGNKYKENIRMVGLDDDLRSEDFNGLSVHEIVELQSKATLDWYQTLLEFVSTLDPPVSCIIADMFVPTTVPIAQQLGIPHVAFWTQSAASYAAYEIYSQNPNYIREQIANFNNEEKSIDFIPCGINLRKHEIPTFLQACDPSDFLFSYIMRCFRDTHLHAHILLNTINDIELEAIKFINKANVSNIGPILPLDFLLENECSKRALKRNSSIWEEDNQCLSWLDQQKATSVLYVSFGSLAALSLEQVVELIMGLEKSEYPILMVNRHDVSNDHNDTFFKYFAKKLSIHHSMCVGWAPQLEVLAHPSVGGFLTHNGWNSTLESLSRGVPLLCWPLFGDQFLDCRLVVDSWKVGLNFEIDIARGLVCQEEIKTKVNYIMDPSKSCVIREQAQKIRQQARELYMSGGKSQINLKKFVEFISKLRSSEL